MRGRRTEWSMVVRAAAAGLAVAAAAACGDAAPAGPTDVVEGILVVVGPDTVLAAEAATYQARAGGRVVDDVEWRSTDPSVLAPGAPAGFFQARAEGTVRITAIAGGQRAEKHVVVRPREPVVPEPRPTLVLSRTDSVFRSLGDTLAVRAVLRYPSGDSTLPTDVVWTARDTSVATVQGGVVVARRNGRVVIEARAGTAQAATEFTVEQRPVSIGTAVAAFEIAGPGQSLQVSATVRDARGHAVPGQPLTWSSSHPERIAVDGTGRLTAPAYGSAQITVRSGELSHTLWARVVGGAAPQLESPRAGLTTVGADSAASYVVIEFGLRDAERDMDSLRVSLVDANGTVLFDLADVLRQGVEAEPFWLHAAGAARAVGARIEAVDAAGNRLSQTVPLKRSPGPGAPVVDAAEFQRVGTDSLHVGLAGSDAEMDVRTIWLVGFDENGGWTMVERFEFPSVDWVEWYAELGVRAPAVARARSWGVMLADQAGNLSAMHVWQPDGAPSPDPLQKLRPARRTPVTGGVRAPSPTVRVRAAPR